MPEDPQHANPQLLEWIGQWLREARERGSRGVTVYRHAYDSLKACPITFEHPSQLQQLKGFGPKLCQKLTENLQKHCEQNGLQMPEHPQTRRASSRDDGDGGEGQASTRAKKTRKPRLYVPTFRSGAYALILALSAADEAADVGMTKAELIESAQPHCDSSFTAPSDPTKFYTAWNSMKTLQQRELVFERGRPLRRYALTDEGWEVAKRMRDATWPDKHNNHSNVSAAAEDMAELDEMTQSAGNPSALAAAEPIHEPLAAPSPYASIVRDGSPIDGDDALPRITPIRLPPGSFTVHLLLDVREIRAKTDRDYMQEGLTKHGVKPIMRSLELGDAQWIAKVTDPTALSRHGAEGDEVVLDWIVERKRLDDLVASIKDGRFHEQKFRLKRSGSKHVVYIVEDISMDSTYTQRYEEAVQSAIASTQVVNGYFLKRTTKMDETIRYLARLTMTLKKKYEQRTLSVIPTRVLTAYNYLPLLRHLGERDPDSSYHVSYAAFASLTSKSDSMTLRDVFLKMLMTTRGVTGERAIELQRHWKTPRALVEAFSGPSPGEGAETDKKRKREMIAHKMSGQVGKRRFARAVTDRIAEIWGEK